MPEVAARPTGRARVHSDAAERPIAKNLQGDLFLVFGQRGQGQPRGDRATQRNRGHSPQVVPACDLAHGLGRDRGHDPSTVAFQQTANDLVVVGHVSALSVRIA